VDNGRKIRHTDMELIPQSAEVGMKGTGRAIRDMVQARKFGLTAQLFRATMSLIKKAVWGSSIIPTGIHTRGNSRRAKGKGRGR
jgi:hypothetical protein